MFFLLTKYSLIFEQGCSCSCSQSFLRTHTPNFAWTQTCTWKMDLTLSFVFLLCLLLRIGLKKYDCPYTSQLFCLSRAGLTEFVFSMLCHLCFVRAVSQGTLPMQGEENCYLRKRINMDSTSRKGLEICIRSVSVVE